MATHRAFLLPLLGVGLTAWVTGLSDRYLVNAFLGAHQAGIYAGTYALFSAPFLIAGTVVLLSVRPRALRLAAEDRLDEARHLLWRYLGIMALGVGALALALFLLRTILVRILLAPPYAAGLGVVPGLVLGNAILALGTILEQHFYLQRRTHLVLLKQVVGSAAALASVALALRLWGFEGAGWACPIYTGIEFVMGLYLVRSLGTRPIIN
jgi:O-antigen/teichoic acid export membrane protein